MASAILYLATGLVWAGRSLLGVLLHPDYWDPVTTVDFIAVWSWSLAFALTAVAVPLIARDAGAGRLASVTSVVVGVCAALAALGNIMEDAFGQSTWSTVYVIGALGTLLGLIALAVLLAIARRPPSALAVFLIVAGMAMSSSGLGVLALAGTVIAARDRLAGKADGPVR